MQNLPVFNIESRRLAALKQLHLLDSDFEEEYNTIALLAAEICQAPIAIISLVDSNRLWFKANIGLKDLREIPRHRSFCDYAVSSEKFLEIVDTSKDLRFDLSPYIPQVYYYAGAPIIDSNLFALGTVCVMDYVPRRLSDSQRKQLRLLADLVIQMNEKRILLEQLTTNTAVQITPQQNKKISSTSLSVVNDIIDPLAPTQGEAFWRNLISSALEKDRFVLYAQPIQLIEPNKKGTFHFEILLRLKGDTGEIIPPGAFMPAAEYYQLANKIDRWVVSNTLIWLAANPSVVQGLNLCSINLSGQTLLDPEFYTFVKEQLQLTQISARKICFELTETAAISNLANTTEFMNKLNALGCSFALDNFGSKGSAIQSLKTLPINFLKIDGQFVKEIVNDPVNLAFVRSINEIAQLLGKKTVAEFVENDAILQSLQQMGVDYAQGYGISMPMNFTRFMAWVDLRGNALEASH